METITYLRIFTFGHRHYTFEILQMMDKHKYGVHRTKKTDDSRRPTTTALELLTIKTYEFIALGHLLHVRLYVTKYLEETRSLIFNCKILYRTRYSH